MLFCFFRIGALSTESNKPDKSYGIKNLIRITRHDNWYEYRCEENKKKKKRKKDENITTQMVIHKFSYLFIHLNYKRTRSIQWRSWNNVCDSSSHGTMVYDVFPIKSDPKRAIRDIKIFRGDISSLVIAFFFDENETRFFSSVQTFY